MLRDGTLNIGFVNTVVLREREQAPPPAETTDGVAASGRKANQLTQANSRSYSKQARYCEFRIHRKANSDK
jgi:hypothetical protein